MDIDDLLAEINNASATTDPSKSKKKKKAKTESLEPKSLNTDQIVKTFEAIKLGDPKKVEENIKNVLDENADENVVQVLDTDVKAEANVDLVDEEKKKKKKKKK